MSLLISALTGMLFFGVVGTLGVMVLAFFAPWLGLLALVATVG